MARIKHRLYIVTLIAIAMIMAIPALANADEAKVTKYHKIPAYQQKDVYAKPDTKVAELSVIEVTNPTVSPVITAAAKDGIEFIFFNTTTQEIDARATTKNGKLPSVTLTEDHNYMITTADKTYRMNPMYAYVKGGKLLNIKDYPTDDAGNPLNNEYNYSTITQLRLNKRDSVLSEPDYNRYTTSIDVVLGASDTAKLYNQKFVLYSDFEEPIEVTSGNTGKIRVALLEDIAYTIVLESDRYEMESFPLVVKDKSEYKGGRYTYDHSCCCGVGLMGDGTNKPIRLYEKGKLPSPTKPTTLPFDGCNWKAYHLDSLSGNTSIDGMDFKDLIAQERIRKDITVGELDGKDYEVYDVKVINPHRWEISKICAGDYTITENIGNKTAESVYELQDDGSLNKLEFNQTGGNVEFRTNSLSIHPIVIEYKEAASEPAVKPVAKATPKMTVKSTTKTLRKSAVKKSAKKISALTVKGSQGKVTYKKVSGSKYLRVDSKTGKITCIKHKCSKKTKSYKIKVKVSCAGNANYKSASKYVYVNVKMK